MNDIKDFSKNRKGTGTNEWAEIKFNIQKGCSNGCLYCYAKARALRFRDIDDHEQWIDETINEKMVNKGWRKRDGVIMFPTTHDITPNNINACVTALANILVVGNQVLIVSKPCLSCIQRLCTDLETWKEQMLFRFTIGSLNTGVCSFWEPGAPDPWERYHALEYAYKQGFQTSVSMEPMLEGCHEALVTFGMVKRYVTETVWIGKMNKMRTRVDMANSDNKFMVEQLEEQQSDEEILKLVSRLKDEPKIRWKDSIKKVMGVS